MFVRARIVSSDFAASVVLVATSLRELVVEVNPTAPPTATTRSSASTAPNPRARRIPILRFFSITSLLVTHSSPSIRECRGDTPRPLLGPSATLVRAARCHSPARRDRLHAPPYVSEPPRSSSGGPPGPPLVVRPRERSVRSSWTGPRPEQPAGASRRRSRLRPPSPPRSRP